MGKNGHKPQDILTLEEALIRFKRKRDEARAHAHTNGKTHPDSNVRYADFSATVKREGAGTTAEVKPSENSASAQAQRHDANAADPAGEDVVAVIGGISRTLEELEHLATTDLANRDVVYAHQFEDAEVIESYTIPVARRRVFSRDYGFALMGTALMTLVAVVVMRAPILGDHVRPTLMAQTIPTPAPLKVSATQMSTDDLITTWIIIPDSDVQLASIPKVQPEVLEAQIKGTLKERAFTDIGVSVSKTGDTYLAGEVYSLDEANRIKEIVHGVNGVKHVHFMHPDVLQATGPAYFGVLTAWEPDIWGAKVRSVSIGSPADKAGIQKGDVISEFDGKTIPDAKTLKDTVAQYTPGQRVQFRVWRKGQPEYLVARLGETTTMASR
jgi:PDZ domain/BON domain